MRPNNFIPFSDITISPNSLSYYMFKLFKECIINLLYPYNIEIKEKEIKEIFMEKLKLSTVWTGIMSGSHCMHVYTEHSTKCFTLCNRKINRDPNDENNNKDPFNKFLCSKHAKKYVPKPRKYKKENISFCISKNKTNENCKNTAVIGNLCVDHYKKEKGIKKQEKISLAPHLYNNHFSIDLSSYHFYEYRKFIDSYDESLNTYYDELISYSKKTFLNKNPAQISWKKEKKEVLKNKNSTCLIEQIEGFNKRIEENTIKFKKLMEKIKNDRININKKLPKDVSIKEVTDIDHKYDDFVPDSSIELAVADITNERWFNEENIYVSDDEYDRNGVPYNIYEYYYGYPKHMRWKYNNIYINDKKKLLKEKIIKDKLKNNLIQSKKYRIVTEELVNSYYKEYIKFKNNKN